jgi:hypothetical protein
MRGKRTILVVAAMMTMMVTKVITMHIRTVLLAMVVVSSQTDTYMCIYKHTHSSRVMEQEKMIE